MGCLVMEYVDGIPVDVYARRRLCPSGRVCFSSSRSRRGAVRPRASRIHRDLKPHNVLVTADGTLEALISGSRLLEPGTAPGRDAHRPPVPSACKGVQSRSAASRWRSPATSTLGVPLYRLLTARAPTTCLARTRNGFAASCGPASPSHRIAAPTAASWTGSFEGAPKGRSALRRSNSSGTTSIPISAAGRYGRPPTAIFRARSFPAH